VVAEFIPPDALAALDAWKERNADALAAVPSDAVRIDIGWTNHPDGSTFARVQVEEEYADRFVR
jgi:hypothetical protein